MFQSPYYYGLFEYFQNKLTQHFPSRKRRLRYIFEYASEKPHFLAEYAIIFWFALYSLCTHFL